MEKEYYSNCCDAPPLDWDVVDACDKATGYCQKCGDGAKFYIQDSDLNDPEFAEIIEEESEKVEKEYNLKQTRSREELTMENMKLNMELITYDFRCKGLEFEVEQLKEKLNKKGVIND